VKMCYAKTSYLWWDGHRMVSAWGVHQGDSLGRFLFCLVIHPLLTEVAKKVVAEFPDLTMEGVFKLFIFYLDDGYVVAKNVVFLRLGELIAPRGILLTVLPSPGISSSQESASTTQILVDSLACSVPRHLHNLAHDSGACLNMDKSPAWWPIAPSADQLHEYESTGISQDGSGACVDLPVGSDTCLRTQLVNMVDELRTRMEVLGYFQDTQAALLFLRIFMRVCCVIFLLRALPQPLAKDAVDVFHDLMQETFASAAHLDTRLSGTWVDFR
jgi:hypothetical protein